MCVERLTKAHIVRYVKNKVDESLRLASDRR
jgi:hypothetical protein